MARDAAGDRAERLRDRPAVNDRGILRGYLAARGIIMRSDRARIF